MNSQIIILITLILLSSFFSACETSFTSANKIKLKSLANNGNKKAKLAIICIDKYSKLLSTILIGNNIVNIVSTTIATSLFMKLFGEGGVTIASFVMTVTIIIFGEIVPKTIASKIPEKFCLFIVKVVYFLIILFTPLSFFVTYIEKFINLFIKNEADNSFSNEELITIVEDAKEDGKMENQKADLLTNAIEFDRLDVNDILTPRVDIVSISVNQDIKEIADIFKDSEYSRLPIWDKSIDNIIGFVHERDFFHMFYLSNERDIKSLIKKTLYTSPHVKASSLLKQLQKEKIHMAVVIDEYGGTEGIITMEDILEELVGEIYDEYDEVEQQLEKRINNSTLLVQGEKEIVDLFEELEIKDDVEYEFNSLSAFMIHKLDKIPHINDSFTFYHYEFIVTKCDGRIVNEVKIIKNSGI